MRFCEAVLSGRAADGKGDGVGSFDRVLVFGSLTNDAVRTIAKIPGTGGDVAAGEIAELDDQRRFSPGRRGAEIGRGRVRVTFVDDAWTSAKIPW